MNSRSLNSLPKPSWQTPDLLVWLTRRATSQACDHGGVCRSNGRHAEFRRRKIGRNYLIRRQNLPPRRHAGGKKSRSTRPCRDRQHGAQTEWIKIRNMDTTSRPVRRRRSLCALEAISPDAARRRRPQPSPRPPLASPPRAGPPQRRFGRPDRPAREPLATKVPDATRAPLRAARVLPAMMPIILLQSDAALRASRRRPLPIDRSDLRIP